MFFCEFCEIFKKTLFCDEVFILFLVINIYRLLHRCFPANFVKFLTLFWMWVDLSSSLFSFNNSERIKAVNLHFAAFSNILLETLMPNLVHLIPPVSRYWNIDVVPANCWIIVIFPIYDQFHPEAGFWTHSLWNLHLH